MSTNLCNYNNCNRLIHLLCRLLLVSVPALFTCSYALGQTIVDECRYSTHQPTEGWEKTEFDHSNWKRGFGGFGRYDTVGGRVATLWKTPDIWIRKSIELKERIESPALLIFHDDDTKVYINGVLVADLQRYTTSYRVITLDQKATDALKLGPNLIAAHCHQTGGGQFIDVHLVDKKNVPTLPETYRPEQPYKSDLTTPWGENVTHEEVWAEYPRPLVKRPQWQSLNGEWKYCITSDDQQAVPTAWDGKILVPYPLESKLSGVGRLLHPDQSLWYSREFEASPEVGKRFILNFEAVDYRCKVYVNEVEIGSHIGGNIPFSFDATDVIKLGTNTLVVRVEDDTEAYQLRGKQALRPQGVWYTRVSGIWQSVWTEKVSETHIKDIKITSNAEQGSISIRPVVSNKTGTQQTKVVVKDQDRVIAQVTSPNEVIEVVIDEAKLWSPDSPHLYELQITLMDESGVVLDQIESYAGIRTVGKTRDSEGNLRFTLNGETLFHWGTLDQGWWPDGLLTPPSDEAMQFEINWLKQAGYNMIRKHIKVEPRRYYYHCDRIGMMVWQDQVSGGIGRNKGWPAWSRLNPNPVDAKWPDKYHLQFMAEFEGMVDLLESQPSIVCWVPFNEAWGQHMTEKVGNWIVKRDPTRLVNIASGGNFWPIGDVVDAHKYPHPDFPFSQGNNGRFDNYVKVVGEFGGHGYPVEKHLWDPDQGNWGYGGLPKDMDEYRQRYESSINKLNELRQSGIAGAVYTQTTDVEGEINGLMTYDRKIYKIDPNDLANIHEVLFESPSISSFQEHQDIQINPDQIRAGLKSHDRALFIKTGWIRDPYITLGPDDYYYLTGTQAREADPREQTDLFNSGLGEESIVGDQIRAYRSKDLIDWESLGVIFSLNDIYNAKKNKKHNKHIWAPEIHFMRDRWALVHCPQGVTTLALSKGKELKGPWTHPMQDRLGKRHDPSLFTDTDGTTYLLWGNTFVAPLNADLDHYQAKPTRIDPSSVRVGPNNTELRRIGHEGATMLKIGNKYVHLGTAWSTDRMRQGSYNLYYCVADSITGPYGPRKFAGRFLGHGTPFQTRDGNWWCTAFYNGNIPPLSRDGIQEKDLSETAQTLNQQGVTIVPLEIKALNDGDIFIRAKDPDYATPGPDEAQKFEN